MQRLVVIIFCLMMGITVNASTADVQLIAYVTVNEIDGYDMHIMDIVTQETVYSMITERHDCPVSFSPDGQYLLYYQRFEESGRWRDAYSLLNIATGTAQMIADYTPDAVWSANSQYLAYSVPDAYQWRHYHVIVFDRQTSTETNIGSTFSISNLQWVNDHTLYFSGSEDEDGARNLYMWDGENTIRILADVLPLDATLLSLSPDSQWLFYQHRTEQDFLQAYLMNIDSQVAMMLDVNFDNMHLFWSPNSEYIALWNRSNVVPIIDVHTQEVVDEVMEDALTGDERMFAPSWSPDGSYLHYAYGDYPDANNTRRIRNIQTGETITVSQYTSGWASRQRWISDTVLLYNDVPISEISETRSHYRESDLFLYDVLTEETTQLTDTPAVNERLECFFG